MTLILLYSGADQYVYHRVCVQQEVEGNLKCHKSGEGAFLNIKLSFLDMGNVLDLEGAF